MASQLTGQIKALAISVGFDDVRITSAEPAMEAGHHLLSWLSSGYSAEMNYLRKSPKIRFDPKRRFPEAKSIICLALNYYQEAESQVCGEEVTSLSENPVGKVARYAWGEDYHLIIEKKLKILIESIVALGGKCWKGYVDHGPLLERAFAERAGLGFIGKNTNLITNKFGSWVFLAEVITDLDLNEDQAVIGECGTCTSCIDACPTDALRAPYQLDARRCISYLTIENKGAIPDEFIGKMDEWVFGCDRCQDVCPYNWKPIPTNEPGLSQLRGIGPVTSKNMLEDIPDNATFKQRFKTTPLLRAKRSGLERNLATLGLQKKDNHETL